jgi:hypothetical protein
MITAQNTDRYADEVVSSNFTYPKEFVRKSEEEQITLLCNKVLGIDPAPVIEHLKQFIIPAVLPPGCHQQDGKYAILSPFGAQLLVPGYSDPFNGDLYCKALLNLFGIIKTERDFYSHYRNQADEYQIQQGARTLEFYKIFSSTQGESPLWILTAQLGLLHKGKSVNRGRETFMNNEFGLSSLAMASILKTHPQRFVRWEELNIYCAGDEIPPDAIDLVPGVPNFYFDGGGLRFGGFEVAEVLNDYGVASGFL